MRKFEITKKEKPKMKQVLFEAEVELVAEIDKYRATKKYKSTRADFIRTALEMAIKEIKKHI